MGGHLTVRVKQHPLGRDPVPALGSGLGGDFGLELADGAIVLGQQDEGPRGIGHRQRIEGVRDLGQLALTAHDGDQVEDAGAGLRSGMLGRLAELAVLVEPPAHLFQLVLDRVDIDERPGEELAVLAAHGRRHRRRSRSIMASAASGPQVPAA